MKRRELIAALASAAVPWPFAADAQQKISRIGVLWPESAPSVRIEEFRQGLRNLGYIEGRNIAIAYRYADGNRDRLSEFAAELVSLNVEVIVALTTLAARPAKEMTQTTPIVMISGEPVETGLVESLARPGGNVTGLTFLSPDLVGKRLQLLKELVPTMTRVGILWDSQGPAKITEFKEASSIAPTLALEIESLELRAPNPDLDAAFAMADERHVGGLLTLGNPLTLNHRKRICELALKRQLPSLYDSFQFVEEGGLSSYGPNFSELYRRSATYVDKILKGANPADLPVEQPTKFELFINLKTANALGLTVPPTILARADKLIE